MWVSKANVLEIQASRYEGGKSLQYEYRQDIKHPETSLQILEQIKSKSKNQIHSGCLKRRKNDENSVHLQLKTSCLKQRMGKDMY